MRRLVSSILLLCSLFLFSGCFAEASSAASSKNGVPAASSSISSSSRTAPASSAAPRAASPRSQASSSSSSAPKYGESFYSKEDVAAYLHAYNELPPNYLTKKEAEALGWSGGNLWKFAPSGVIGGDRFGNREGLLPKVQGRKYYECDVNYSGGRRGSERLIYSNDGMIYYTADHYASFTLLYGEEGKR